MSSDVKAARLARVQAAYGIVQRRLERAVVDRTQELARRTRLIRMLGRIAEAAAAAETVGDMLRVGVDEISAFLRWPVGHAYHLPEGWPGRLVSTDTWKIRAPDTKAIASFRRASRDVPKRGKSIVGRALAARHALWVEDLADRNIAFIRRPAAAGAGFKSGILLPVLAAGAPVAVLEFYTTAKTPVDAAILSALNQVANHIGQVAERVAARAAQHRSEAVLAAVFANAVDPILVIDEKGIVQSANPAVERVFGFAPLDVIGRNVSMMMPPDVAQRHDGYLRRYLRTGKANIIGHGREITARRKSGETFPADLAVGEIDVGGRRLFAGTIRDLSERRSAEASLRTAQQQLADAIDHGGNSISLYDAGERLVIFNAEFRRVIEPFFGPDLKPGVRFEELARRLAAGGFYGGVRGEDWVQERCRAFRALEPMNLDKIEPDGTKQSGFVSYYRTRDGGTLVVNNDVTALREAEEKAQAVQRRFGEAIDGLADGIALYGPDERLVMCNRAYRDDLAFIGDIVKPGVSFEDVLRGLSDTQIYDGGGEDWIKSRLAAFRALKDTDVHFNSPQGRKWIRIRRFRASDGGTLLVRSDITAYRMAEEQAQAAQQQLVDAIEGIEDGIALYDRAEKLVMMNASYRRAVRTGESDPVAGETFEDLTRRLAAAGHYSKGTGEDVVRQRMAQFRALETVLISAQEADGPHHLVVRHYRTRDGGTLIVRGDVTEQHRAEEQAMTAHQRLADAIEGISDGVALFDRDERLVLFNRPYVADMAMVAEILKPGLGYKTLIRALTRSGYYGAVDAEAHVRARLERFRNLEEVEVLTVLPDGTKKWRQFRHYRTRDGGTLLVRIDITERKRIEAELDFARRNLQVALDSSTDGMAMFDASERLVLCNESYRRAVPSSGDIFKPGLFFEDQIRQLMAAGRYPGKDENWLRERLRRFRALEDTSFPALSPEGERQVSIRHYRTRDGGTFLVRSDVTERHEAEKRIAALQHRLTEAIDSVADGMMLFDDQERMVLANEAYRNIFAPIPAALEAGITFEGQIRILMAAGRYPGRSEAWIRWRVEQFRTLATTSHSVQTPEGTKHITVRHYRTRDGGTFMVRSDVTAQREAEDRLRALQHRLTDSIDSSTDGMALFDDRERMALVNETYRRAFAHIPGAVEEGVAFEDHLRILWAAGRYPGRDESWIRLRVEQFRALEPVVNSVSAPDGMRHLDVRHFRTRDGGTFMVQTDVTERREAEAQALIQGQRLADAVESVGDAIGLFDADERLVLFNGAYAQLLGENADLLKPGVSLESMVWNLAARRFYKDYPGEWAQNRIQAFRDLKTVEYRIQRSDGERWMVARHFRIRDGGIFLVVTDITERMRAMQALERARSEAESANAAKTRFLSSMSHELRTPLNAILGFGQLLDMGQNRMPEEKRQEYTGIILKSGQHLLDLISQVLELSKIENRDIEIKPQTLTPAKMMRECVDMVWEEAKRRAVEIIDATGEGGPGVQFRGDPLRVRQVLINLLSNAVKYNRQGGRVTVRCAEQDGMVRFDVVDTGAGIPASRRDEVFRPFHRLGREAGTIEGSGIGLAIARELVQRMGGHIGFDSLPGEGSTFWFELPAAKPEERV